MQLVIFNPGMQKITFPGQYENLARIGELVEKAALEAGFDEPAAYAIQLAVDEACSNIIEHAYGGEGVGDIHLSLQASESELTITLRDHGQPFDPKLVPAPILGRPIEEVEEHGLGLYLMGKMMDEVRFEFTADGNTLTMTKRK
jgi:serine/threonine-protein kinase RsbW